MVCRHIFTWLNVQRKLRAIAFLCAALGGAEATAAVDFIRSSLNLPASTSAFETRYDLDGDNRRDLLAVYQRRIMIFFQTGADAFPSAPDIEIGSADPIPDHYAAVTVGKVNDEVGQQLIFLSPEGADYVSLSRLKSEPSVAVQLQPLLTRKLDLTPGPNLEFVTAALDIDGDGKTDLMLPKGFQLEIYSQGTDGKYEQRRRIELDTQKSQTTRLVAEKSLLGSPIFSNPYAMGAVKLLPASGRWHSVDYSLNTFCDSVLVADFNMDHLLDLVVPTKIYFQSADGNFSEVPSAAHSRIAAASIPHEHRNTQVSQPNLLDFNQDGILDTFRVESTTAKLGPRTDLSILLGRKDRSFPDQPDIVLRTKDFAYSDAIPVGDVNGDGAMDVALFHLDFQASSMNSQLKAYLRNGLEGDLRFYVWDKTKGKFPDDPAFTHPVLVNYEIYGARQFFRQQVVIDQDMNGDELADLVLKTGPQEFSVFQNQGANKGFARKASALVSTAPTRFSSLVTQDLNNDKRGDVVISGYIDGQDDRIIYSLFLSK